MRPAWRAGGLGRCPSPLRRKRGRLPQRAADLEIEVAARVMVERLQQVNRLIARGPPAPMGGMPSSAHGPLKNE